MNLNTLNESLVLAALEVNTNAHIRVHVLESGSETAVLTNYFSFTSVTNMYRTKNLRAGGASSTDPPPNWPDELTNGKDFVFVHGYNVTESAGRGWNNNMFKRLWHSGSDAKYNAVLWDGSPPAPLTWEDSPLPRHYHNAVINSLASAPALADYLNSLDAPAIMAHSLGNMITSEAICRHNAAVSQYYAVDAAVALEAYGDSSPDEAMTADNVFDRMDAGLFSNWIPFWSDINEYSWNDYPKETWASEWYRLFPENDPRFELTWRHRFADLQERCDAFNFYSSSEEVLRVNTDTLYFISAASSKYVWQIQEQFKGRKNSSLLTGLVDWVGGASSSTCGWRFNEKASSMHIVNWGPIKWCPVRPRTLQEKLSTNSLDRAATRLALQTDPLFYPEPEELFGAGAESFVSGTVGANGANLDYNTSNATYPISDLLVRDWLLAKAFPSRTGPMGSASVGDIGGGWKDVNFDMHTVCRNPSSGLPSGSNHDEWYHNDINKAPYLYVYRLFDQITGKEVAE